MRKRRPKFRDLQVLVINSLAKVGPELLDQWLAATSKNAVTAGQAHNLNWLFCATANHKLFNIVRNGLKEPITKLDFSVDVNAAIVMCALQIVSGSTNVSHSEQALDLANRMRTLLIACGYSDYLENCHVSFSDSSGNYRIN